MATQADREMAGDWTPNGLAARAASADRRARAALTTVLTDLALADRDRLDERTRVALGEHGRAAIVAIEAAIRRHAVRLLGDEMTVARAEAGTLPAEGVVDRLIAAGVLLDRELVGELLARVRQDRLTAALPVAVSGPDEPSLLVRLSLAPDVQVARAASALLASESRRRDQFERGQPDGGDLPLPLYERLAWQVAAAMRDDADDAARDRALAEATRRCLGAQDDSERTEVLAMRLAAAIDPRPAEIASLLVEAIGDRRLGFFIALLAHMLGLSFDQARGIVQEAAGERLWLALRALKLERTAIARIGLALGDADPARDVEAFAERLDMVVAIPAAEARAALAPLTLDARFVAAIRSLESGR